MNPYVRSLLSLATLTLIALYGSSMQPALPLWGMLAALCLLYQTAIWVRDNWWTSARYASFVGLAIALSLIISLTDGGRVSDSILLIPSVLLLAREQHPRLQRGALLLAAGTMLAMLALLRFSSLAFSVLPAVLTAYVCIRAINIYKEAHQASQRHLEALDMAHRELQQAHAELQEASALSMRYAALMERTRLAREMHDGLGHQLTTLIVQLQALKLMLEAEPERAEGEIQAMLQVARDAMAEVRHAVSEWREDESELGLAALRGLISQTAARSRLTLDLQAHGPISAWRVEMSVALYRIVQEALTNIMRHASATSAIITLDERDQRILLTVADDGEYTTDTDLTPGFGLKGIMERCEALGGSCTLSQNLPHGLILRIILPLDAPVDGAVSQTSPAEGRAVTLNHA